MDRGILRCLTCWGDASGVGLGRGCSRRSRGRGWPDRQPVYRKGNEYISPDVDRHKGGIWKKASGDSANLRNRSTRDGTYNEDLTERVDE